MTDNEETIVDDNTTYDKKDLLKALKSLQAEGSVSPEEIKMMRKELGFTQSSFTKSPKDKVKKKVKNKMARKARKANRGK